MQRRARALFVLLPVIVAMAQVADVSPARGQTDQTTTTPVPYPTTTSRPDDGLNSTRRNFLATSTIAPQAAPSGKVATVTSPSPAPRPGVAAVTPAPSSPYAPAPDPGPTPPFSTNGVPGPPITGPNGAPAQLSPGTVQSSIDYLVGAGGNNTRALLDALRPLEAIGFTPHEAAMMGMGHFPVAGYATFRDDWGDARGNGTRTHKGNDIFAAFDVPVRAPVDGVLRYSQEGLGGNSAYVTAADGTYYYLAHLNSFAPDLVSGAHVTQGQFIGMNGDSGNARGGTPHVHFEVHPGGGEAVNPNPILNTWLAEAVAAAPAVVAAHIEDIPQPGAVISTGLTRRFDDLSFSPKMAPMVGPRLWESSVNPVGSALSLAQANAARAADAVDWERRAEEEQNEAVAWRRAEQDAQAQLWRLTPPGLNGLVVADGL